MQLKETVKESIFGVRKMITSKAIREGAVDGEDANVAVWMSCFESSGTSGECHGNKTGECVLARLALEASRRLKNRCRSRCLEDDVGSDSEWQMRGYMWLYNRDCAIVDYCLVDRPKI